MKDLKELAVTMEMNVAQIIEADRVLQISKINLILSKLLPVKEENLLCYEYFEIIIYALMLEGKFPEEFKATKKEILKNCNIPFVDTVEEINDLFQELYSPSHNLRFGIETMDSIEEVRVFIKEHGWKKLTK